MNDSLMRFLKENDFITLNEARRLGINPMTLSRLVANEDIFRTDRGVYTHDLAWLTDPLKKYLPACTQIPEAVICGVSALSYYDLTDEEERKTWIAIPVQKKLKDPRYRVIRTRGLGYSLGIEIHKFGKRSVRIYDREKAVVDAFKYLTEETALKALKGYLKLKTKDIHKLSDYGRKLRKPLDDLVRALMAEE
jgi:Predicted transcriptional regulator